MYNNYFIGAFMAAKIFSGDQKIKLTQLINEGMAVMHEIDTLNGGLTDTVKAIAEELEVKPSILKKAIRVAHKASLTQTNMDNEQLNTILETVGKTL
jgi:transposase-like protein